MKPFFLVLLLFFTTKIQRHEVSSLGPGGQDDLKPLVDQLADKDAAKWRHAAYRLIEKGATAEQLKNAAPRARVEMVLWEVKALKDHAARVPAYAWVTIADGSHTLPDIVADMEKQTSLTFDKQGFDRYMGEDIQLEAALDRVPVLDALDRLIGTRIMDYTSVRGRIRVWSNTRTHSWRYGFGHTSVRLGSISWTRSNRFLGKVDESVTTSLSFVADPRLAVGGAGVPVLVEAVDDTGAVLEAIPRDESVRWTNLRFKPPAEKATKIARLAGYIPYHLVTKSEAISFAPPEKGKDAPIERGGVEVRVKLDMAAVPKGRVEAKAKDAKAPAVYPLRMTLVGKDPKHRVEGTCDERAYSTSVSSWEFVFSKPPDGFELASVELEWPVEHVELRAWFEFTDLPLK